MRVVRGRGLRTVCPFPLDLAHEGWHVDDGQRPLLVQGRLFHDFVARRLVTPWEAEHGLHCERGESLKATEVICRCEGRVHRRSGS